jgi:FkbM family methyltransferase
VKHLLRQYKRKQFYKKLFGQKNGLAFDVGAHNGTKSKILLQLGYTVVAVEPQADCIKQLEELKLKFPDLKIENCALSDKEGETDFFIGSHSETSTLSPDFKLHYESLGTASYKATQKVQTKTLNQLTDIYGIPVFLKLDCEGQEEAILQPLAHPIVLIEFEYLKPLLVKSIACIQKLSSLGKYEFNFSRNEEPVFYFKEWSEQIHFIEQLKKLPGTILHGNIYAKLVS